MPYVPVLTEKPADLSELAERRWQGVREARPELGPAIDLQRRLMTVLVELAAMMDARGLPRLSLPPRYLAAKLTRGVPGLAGEPIPLPVSVLTPVLARLCAALAEGGAGETAIHIQQAIESGSLEAGSLLAASLARNQSAIRIGAAHRGLAPDLVWLVAELAVGPYAHALQRLHFEGANDEALKTTLDAWSHGYCPACGSWPAVAEVVGGRRMLRCSFCASAWELSSSACVYCEHAPTKQDRLVTWAPDEARGDRRLEICSACGGYLKSIDIARLSPFPLLSISDIETTDLDIAAMDHGYQRPPMKEFTRR